jgi:hypothetical protein
MSRRFIKPLHLPFPGSIAVADLEDTVHIEGPPFLPLQAQCMQTEKRIAFELHIADGQGLDRPAGFFVFGLQVDDLQGLPIADRRFDDPDLLFPGAMSFRLGILKSGQKFYDSQSNRRWLFFKGCLRTTPSRDLQRDRATYICPWAKAPLPTSITAFLKVFLSVSFGVIPKNNM